LEIDLAAAKKELAIKNELINSLQHSVHNLESNMSCLYLTASHELKRRDAQIANLRQSR